MKYFSLTLVVALFLGLITCQQHIPKKMAPYISKKLMKKFANLRPPSGLSQVHCFAYPGCFPEDKQNIYGSISELPKVQQELIAPFQINYGLGPVVYPFPDVQMIEIGGIVGPRRGDYGLSTSYSRYQPKVESLMEEVDELYVDSPYWNSKWGMGPVIVQEQPNVQRTTHTESYNDINSIKSHNHKVNSNHGKDIKNKASNSMRTFNSLPQYNAERVINPEIIKEIERSQVYYGSQQ
ncbi:UNKNOWN [Stylonychia lemnae]|uniref:Uncharacterized protein n=1 Tax=Stylonychia lemnae TaxID=5949 RepID=A0A078B380_STYLE|nr:UNKNOWN [Stylonychia lemnae]|eukprot:CDW88726.1 UNKNOWN [Stylonychia lemnae]